MKLINKTKTQPPTIFNKNNPLFTRINLYTKLYPSIVTHH